MGVEESLANPANLVRLRISMRILRIPCYTRYEYCSQNPKKAPPRRRWRASVPQPSNPQKPFEPGFNFETLNPEPSEP